MAKQTHQKNKALPKDRQRITFYLKKEDGDIAQWLNIVLSEGQPLAVWLGALAVAYTEGRRINTGSKPALNHQKTSDLMIGRGDSTKKRKVATWTEVSNTTRYEAGDIVSVRTYHAKAIKALHAMKNDKNSISAILRTMIRVGFQDVEGNKPNITYAESFLQGDEGEQDLLTRLKTLPFGRQEETVSVVMPEPKLESPDLAYRETEQKPIIEPAVIEPVEIVEPIIEQEELMVEDEKPKVNTNPNPLLGMIL